MVVIDKLSTSLNRSDEVPNQELAREIAVTHNTKALSEVVQYLYHKNKGIQSDCIKVIYELGMINPAMIAEYTPQLIDLLHTKNNRLQWGAMTALATITSQNPKAIYNALPKILEVADKGSVITNDNCVRILVKLCAIKAYGKYAFELLIERLKRCPINQLAMYSEIASTVPNNANKSIFIRTISKRFIEITKDSQRVRLERIIKKLKE